MARTRKLQVPLHSGARGSDDERQVHVGCDLYLCLFAYLPSSPPVGVLLIRVPRRVAFWCGDPCRELFDAERKL